MGEVGVLTFEVAELIAKAYFLNSSLSPSAVADLWSKAKSDKNLQRAFGGSAEDVWAVHALDKRAQVRHVAADVIRLGKRSGVAILGAPLALQFTLLGAETKMGAQWWEQREVLTAKDGGAAAWLLDEWDEDWGMDGGGPTISRDGPHGNSLRFGLVAERAWRVQSGNSGEQGRTQAERHSVPRGSVSERAEKLVADHEAEEQRSGLLLGELATLHSQSMKALKGVFGGGDQDIGTAQGSSSVEKEHSRLLAELGLGLSTIQTTSNRLWKRLFGGGKEETPEPLPPPQGVTATAEKELTWLVSFVPSTADLHDETVALDQARASLSGHRTFSLEVEAQFGIEKPGLDLVDATSRHELQALIEQKKMLVEHLRLESLWSLKLGQVVRALALVVFLLHDKLVRAFRPHLDYAAMARASGQGFAPIKGAGGLLQKSGSRIYHRPHSCGPMALQYARVLVEIGQMLVAPERVTSAARERLYALLPHKLRRAVQKDEGGILKDLNWLLPMAKATVAEMSGASGERGSKGVPAMDTLVYVDQGIVEGAILGGLQKLKEVAGPRLRSQKRREAERRAAELERVPKLGGLCSSEVAVHC